MESLIQKCAAQAQPPKSRIVVQLGYVIGTPERFVESINCDEFDHIEKALKSYKGWETTSATNNDIVVCGNIVKENGSTTARFKHVIGIDHARFGLCVLVKCETREIVNNIPRWPTTTVRERVKVFTRKGVEVHLATRVVHEPMGSGDHMFSVHVETNNVKDDICLRRLYLQTKDLITMIESIRSKRFDVFKISENVADAN